MLRPAMSGWLTTINPLVKLLSIMGPMLVMVATRGVAVPATVAGLALVAILSGVRLQLRIFLIASVALIAFSAWMTIFFAWLVQPETVASTPVLALGPFSVRLGALAIGLGTAVRFAAMVLLAMLGSLGTTLEGLRSALVAQAKVPYRFAYGVVATARFVPRFSQSAGQIRTAQRARGVVESRGPLGALKRAARSFLPMLADGVRHAERMSLAMDARGFGAHRYRVDRQPAQLRLRDAIFAAAILAGIAAIYLIAARYDLVWFVSDFRRI